MNCFQNLCIFASETTPKRQFHRQGRCELLSKFVYICIRNNHALRHVSIFLVVNCFQNLCIFASETTNKELCQSLGQLWIAFKICVYLHQKQLIRSYVNHWDSCELLSKFVYICIRNNIFTFFCSTYWVVNCFQNLCIFASETTIMGVDEDDAGCELLSKFVYICIRNNWKNNFWIYNSLWIAFKICVYLHQKQHDRCKLLTHNKL